MSAFRTHERVSLEWRRPQNRATKMGGDPRTVTSKKDKRNILLCSLGARRLGLVLPSVPALLRPSLGLLGFFCLRTALARAAQANGTWPRTLLGVGLVGHVVELPWPSMLVTICTNFSNDVQPCALRTCHPPRCQSGSPSCHDVSPNTCPNFWTRKEPKG